jgi:hypothetical protein
MGTVAQGNEDIQRVLAFWKWFSQNSRKLAENLENGDLLHELDRRVCALGKGCLTWEVGPGLHKPFQLVISPGGKRELLDETKKIISAAPDIPEWELHYAKPPKSWRSPKFLFRNASGKELTIDAERWEYVLLRFPDGTFHLIVRIRGYEDLNEAEQLMAVEILLDGVIGELDRLQRIATVEIVSMLDRDLRRNANTIGVLREHMHSLSESSA